MIDSGVGNTSKGLRSRSRKPRHGCALPFARKGRDQVARWPRSAGQLASNDSLLRPVATAIACALLLLAAACATSPPISTGKIVNPAEIVVGVTTRDGAIELLGSPELDWARDSVMIWRLQRVDGAYRRTSKTDQTTHNLVVLFSPSARVERSSLVEIRR